MSYAHKRAIALLVCLVLLLAWPERSTSNISHLPSNQNATTQQHQKSNTETIQDRHLATEEAIAYYNKWLMFFTAMLALATLGLGFATVGLYLTSKRQIALARDEFLSSHRPRMRLKHMWLTDDTAWRLGGPLEVNLDIGFHTRFRRA